MKPKERVDYLMLQQRFNAVAKDDIKTQKKKSLDILGIKKDSEFYEFYSNYIVLSLEGRKYTSELSDCFPPFDYLASSIEFGHEVWKLPKNYLLFSSGEGEGGYLYNKDDGSVWDFDLGNQELLGTNQLKHWDSFYEFLIWYLTVDEDEN